ncbi:hypothetical protein H6G81_33390 [Scytonema hofmannii FACHB-248]|uniref:Uncharacterized protein n=1 Tax=Scytonema hofmannii FACHB-248 TaxID=1842502 RepID=A0ABR8H181_9CYAN|nr:hypothetical protein [[Scytonema hofmanni] UTEX B 1581]MBD2609269.1 hypothetical protein [Scytonema hofmannii FACHB-248]
MGNGQWAMGIKRSDRVFHKGTMPHAPCPMPIARCPMPDVNFLFDGGYSDL